MARTFVEKALARAAGRTDAAAGEIVDARPDMILSHDNTAAIARLFASLGQERVMAPDRIAIVLDHAVPAPTVDHARNHAEARAFARAQGIAAFYDTGFGICHQVVAEQALVLPGGALLGADSHTPHAGWLGAFAAGIGRSEVAALWATGELWLRVPDTIRIDLYGRLPQGVTTKDLSLALLRELGPEAGIYSAIEFGGPGLATLSITSRMVLPNMMAEAGVKSAYLEPDDIVFDWLAPRLARRLGIAVAEARESIASNALYPDPGARYISRLQVQLDEIEPLVALPHNPARGVPLAEVAGRPVDLAFLGTCTNGRLEDLAVAAAILRDGDGRVRSLARGTRLVVVPASREILLEAIRLGYMQTLVEAGAMVGTPGCGPCMGNHFGIPASGERVISTANRNFRGRMGNPEAEIYLASPAVVVASAVRGCITDGRAFDLTASDAVRPTRTPAIQVVAESHRRRELGTAAAATGGESVCLSGRAWAYGDDVNTDVIFPGKYTYTIRDEAEMAHHAFEDLDPAFAANVKPGDIVVGGRNFGCGSSREQAVTCLRAAGVPIVIAASFGRIYYRNAINNGLLPVACPDAALSIRSGENVTVDLTRCVVNCEAGAFPFPAPSPSVRATIDAGGLLAMLRSRRTRE